MIPLAPAPPVLTAGGAAVVKRSTDVAVSEIRDAHFASLARVPPPGSLAHAPVDIQRRWNNRTILDLTLLLAALLGPVVGIYLLSSPGRYAVLLPIASLLSSLGILGVGLLSPGFMFGGLRPARGASFAEAAVVAVGGAAMALLYAHFVFEVFHADHLEFNAIRAELGVLLTLFVVAVCPAIFEELAFRGLVHARLQAMLGAAQGRYLTAAAFALCHGLTPGFPFHVALGLYLGWLRDRSQSLLPGMAAHFLYNALIVLFLG